MAAYTSARSAGSVSRLLTLLHRGKVSRKILDEGYAAACFVAWQPKRTLFNFRPFDRKKKSNTGQLIRVPDDDQAFREKYIPITRRSMVRHLMQEEKMLTEEEVEGFESFALALDSAIVNRYHGLLQELKALFDPINPDKDTITTRNWNRRERLDNEFWVLQKLSSVMEKANFHKLPDSVVDAAFAQHCAREGIEVSVNRNNYDVCQFWALGRETPPETLPTMQRLYYAITAKPLPTPLTYYKRVCVAVRLKRDDKLWLKAFKEVPVNALEQLMPDGKIQMSNFDRNILATSLSIAALGGVAKIVTILAHVNVDWTLIFTGVMALWGMRAWTSYKNRHLAYMNQLTRMLYFKNIANNRGLLTAVVDRAEDELFKESLLVYSFLLANRPPSLRDVESSDQSPEYLGLMTEQQLEAKIQDWVLRKTGAKIMFSALDAVTLLGELGILSKDLEENLHVLPLDAATRNLPLQPQSLTARQEEHDMVEGYDRDVTEETEEEYKEEEKKRSKYGWW